MLENIFSKQPIKTEEASYYDLPVQYLRKSQTNTPLVWEFWWEDVVDEISSEWWHIKEEDLDIFRVEFIRRFIEKYEPDFFSNAEDNEPYITVNKISDFMVLCAENKIYTDSELQKLRRLFYLYSNATKPDLSEVDFEEDDTQWRHNIQWEGIDAWELNEAEKEFLKNHTEKRIHPHIDATNFTKLKEFLIDPLWENFQPLWWQRFFLQNQKRKSYIATSRRSGKSTLAAYLAIRQLMLPMQQVIIVVPTLKNHAKPLMKAIDNFLYRWYWSKAFKIDHQSLQIENKTTKSVINFFTAQNNEAVRWQAANLLIIDEAAFVSENIFQTAEALTRTTKWASYVISTVNPDTPKNWFYYKLIDAEISYYKEDTDKIWFRVTLDDNPIIPEEEKEDIKKDAWVWNQALFLADWYCTFISSDGFDLKKFWKVTENYWKYMVWGRWAVALHNNIFNKNYWKIFICYDAAFRRDKAWVILLWVTQEWHWEVLMAEYLESFQYFEQVDLILELKEFIWKKWDILLDYQWVWVAVQQIFEQRWIYTKNIMPVWWSNWTQEWTVYKVWKELLDSSLKSQMSMGHLTGFSYQRLLRIEFETYDDSRKSKWHHNDLLSALQLWVAWCARYKLLWVPEKPEPKEPVTWTISEAIWHMFGFEMEKKSSPNSLKKRMKKFWY